MTARILPDADVRHAILHDTDVNMVVEAAAGTGKTTCLVGRLLTLFRRGALAENARLAAVTFTHKAAAELRERLDRELAALLAKPSALEPGELDNLRRAVDALPECHIGTIHSFCARLLREHPVESGIGPDFGELDDEDDRQLRRQAWDALAAEMADNRHRDLAGTFALFGLDQAQLADGFIGYAEYPDVDRWIGEDEGEEPDPVAFLAGLERFIAALPDCGPSFHEADPGTDTLMPAVQIARRRLSRMGKSTSLAEAHRLAGLFGAKIKVTQKQWIALGVDKTAAKELPDIYAPFYERVVRPFREACLSTVYKATLRAFALAGEIYARLRRERGVLNFQDLLLSTASMLKRYPAVRRALSRRYPRLLIDEVQDTDPIQAEIMFLLSGDGENENENAWRDIVPRPGSLFIVGDPKQSIYRFRRADIVVYQEMKDCIRRTGGRVVGLSSNFRSHPDIVDWVNRAYGPDESMAEMPDAWVAASGRFGVRESAYGPAYIALQPALERRTDCFAGVFALETLKEDRKNGRLGRDIVRDEAARIASFIRHAVDTGLALPDKGGATRPAEAGDFLVVTYTKSASAIYAEALRRLKLPCVVSSGGTLKNSSTLAALSRYIAALAQPDNAILSTAVLRGGLFGIADTELYRWKQAGGTFAFTASKPDAPSPVGDALRTLAEHARWFERHPPAQALEMVVDSLGLWADSCLDSDPDTSAGALAAALDILSGESIPTVGKLSERLLRLIESHEEDTLPAQKPESNAVRVMNLHKTKGLEAPVVFLASTRSVKTHPPLSAIRREDGAAFGGLAIRAGEYKEKLLAQPAGWPALEDDEALFLAAEKTRLNYVAATRARAALVLSLHQTADGWQSKFLPAYRSDGTIPEKLAEPPLAAPEPPSAVPAVLDGEALSRLAAGRAAKLEKIIRPTCQTMRAKPENDWRLGYAGASDLPPEQAALLGEVVHRLLQNSAGADQSVFDVAALLAAFELPAAWAEAVHGMVDAVWSSAIWTRANQSSHVFREAPFTLCRTEGGVEVLERGVIDLVFREGNGWVIVDYKTDAVTVETAAAAARRHKPQLDNYAAAWQSITGEQVIEKGILFVRINEYKTTDKSQLTTAN